MFLFSFCYPRRLDRHVRLKSKSEMNVSKMKGNTEPRCVVPCNWHDTLRNMEIGVQYCYPSFDFFVRAITRAQKRLMKSDGMGFINTYDIDTSFIVVRTR